MITSTHRSTPYYDPLADDSVITRYLAEITTLESLDPSYCNLTFPRQKFIDELPKEIGRRIFRPVALHIFGGGAGELLGGPAGTDVDICISRRTFREYDISAVGSILLESAISFLWECNRIAKGSALFCPERIVHAYGLTIHPHGDTILLKIRSGIKTEFDISVRSFFGESLLSPSGVSGFMYDITRKRFSCVAGSVWCDNELKFNYFKNLLLDRIYEAANALSTNALFSQLVHVRAHAFTIRKDDLDTAINNFHKATQWEVAKIIVQGLKSHFRTRKEALIDLITALTLLLGAKEPQMVPKLAEKYALGWSTAKPWLGLGPEIFFAELVILKPHLLQAVLGYLHGFFLIEYGLSDRIGACQFTINERVLERPMFSIKATKNCRFIALRNEGSFPPPAKIIQDFLAARKQLIHEKVDLKSFDAVLKLFELSESGNSDEETLLGRVVILWLLPKIQTLSKKVLGKKEAEITVQGQLQDLKRSVSDKDLIQLVETIAARLSVTPSLAQIPAALQIALKLVADLNMKAVLHNKEVALSLQKMLLALPVMKEMLPLEIAIIESGCVPSESRKKELVNQGFLLCQNEGAPLGKMLLKCLLQLPYKIAVIKPIIRRMERLLLKNEEQVLWEKLQFWSEIYVNGDKDAEGLEGAIRGKKLEHARQELTRLKRKELPLPLKASQEPYESKVEKTAVSQKSEQNRDQDCERQDLGIETLFTKLSLIEAPLPSAKETSSRAPSESFSKVAEKLQNPLLLRTILHSLKEMIMACDADQPITLLYPVIELIQELDDQGKLPRLFKFYIGSALRKSAHKELRAIGREIPLEEASEEAWQEVTIEYLKMVLSQLQDGSGNRQLIVQEFTELWRWLKLHIKSKEAKKLASEAIIRLFGHSHERHVLVQGIRLSVHDVMDDSPVALLFIDELFKKPKELFRDEVLQVLDLLFTVAIRRHLSQNARFDGISVKLFDFLLHFFANDITKEAYKFTNKHFLAVMEKFTTFQKMPSQPALVRKLLQVLTNQGFRHVDWDALYTYFTISKRFTPAMHSTYIDDLRTLILPIFDGLPVASKPSQQEGLFQLFLSLFPLFREIEPEKLAMCLLKLKECPLNEELLSSFLNILHGAVDSSTKGLRPSLPLLLPGEVLNELVITNLKRVIDFPLRNQCMATLSLLEKLHALPFSFRENEIGQVLIVHLKFVNHLFYAVLKRGSFESGEGLLDRYVQKALLPFKKQLEAESSKIPTFLRPLSMLNAQLKAIGLHPIFLPHWIRWYFKVDSEITGERLRLPSLIGLTRAEQLRQLELHKKLVPREFQGCSDDFLQEMSCMGVDMINGLKREEIQELAHKASSSRLLESALLNLILSYEEALRFYSRKNQKVAGDKARMLSAVKRDFKDHITMIEQAFQSIISANQRLKELMQTIKGKIES